MGIQRHQALVGTRARGRSESRRQQPARGAHVRGDERGAGLTRRRETTSRIASEEQVAPRRMVQVSSRTISSIRGALLFCVRAKRIARAYFNETLIPALCRKAGVPRDDARGRTTSHRARSTIASQLYNANEPMTLFELPAWL